MIRTYKLLRKEREVIGGLAVLKVEVDFPTRKHYRLIGADKGSPETFGTAIVYVDQYKRSPERVHTYARHSATSGDFFAELNVFFQSLLAEGSYNELKASTFPAYVNIGGGIKQESLSIPIDESSQSASEACFFRMDLAFGSMSIEFGASQVSNNNELDIAWSGEVLRSLDGPILACEFTRGDTYLPLFLRLHWAREYLGKSTLRSLVDEASLQGVC